ncbi:MAG: head-tail adaptor protein [Clostridiales bacterium]|nr:head-tail adaptor protein [Clostridiales bacterium]
MSFGKMNAFVSIVQADLSKDTDGFSISADMVLASVRAYKEERHGSKFWANRATFSSANCLFRFRLIPGLEITTKLAILCDGLRYKILSAENVQGRGMYIEVLAESLKASKQ